MLSYQHGYHAGGLAGAHWHAALCRRRCEKAKPLCYLKAHAGRGLRDLSSPHAERAGEANAGILRLIAEDAVAEGRPLAQAIRMSENLRYGQDFCPGSP